MAFSQKPGVLVNNTTVFSASLVAGELPGETWAISSVSGIDDTIMQLIHKEDTWVLFLFFV